MDRTPYYAMEVGRDYPGERSRNTQAKWGSVRPEFALDLKARTFAKFI